MKKISRTMILGLVGLAMFTSNLQNISAQTAVSNNIEKVKSDVRTRAAAGGRAVVILNNGFRMEGFIGNILDESFDLIDAKTRQPTTIPYRDVAEIKKTGGSSGAKTALGIGIGPRS